MPGYRMKTSPIFEGKRIAFLFKLEGLGDYSPTYCNLDTMIALAAYTHELFAAALQAECRQPASTGEVT